MNVLLTGPRALVSEWSTLCREHAVYVYGRHAMDLPEGVVHVPSIEEAPGPDIVINLHVRASRKRMRILSELLAETDERVPVLCNTAAVTATELAAHTGAPERIAGVAALPGMTAAPLVEICFPFGGSRRDEGVIERFFASCGKSVAHVADEIGMVFPRTIVLILNEAAYAHQCGTASRADIDTAMMLGVNYPAGPFIWGETLGWRNVHSVLSALHAELGDDRYRPATLIRKLAMMG